MKERRTQLLRAPVSPPGGGGPEASSPAPRLPSTHEPLSKISSTLLDVRILPLSILSHVDFLVPRLCNSEYVPRGFQTELFFKIAPLPHCQKQISKENFLK